MKKKCCKCCCCYCCCPKPIPVEQPIVNEPVVDEPFFSALSTTEVEKTNDGIWAKILAALAILAMLVTAWIYFMPNNVMKKNIEHRPQKRIIEKNEDVDRRLDEIERDVSIWGHRTWLLGLANNENSCLSKKIDMKCHPCENSDYIFFNNNWSTNRPMSGRSF